MRVVHLLRKYDPAEWGGTETAIHRLTSGLVAHDIRSVVYAPRLALPEAGRDPLAESGCRVRRFRAWAPIWGLSAERKRQVIAVGGNLISFDLAGALWRERDIDLIHSHTLGRLGAIGRVVARGRRLPFVVSVHGGVYDLPEAVRERFARAGRRRLGLGQAAGPAPAREAPSCGMRCDHHPQSARGGPDSRAPPRPAGVCPGARPPHGTLRGGPQGGGASRLSLARAGRPGRASAGSIRPRTRSG